MEYLQIGLAVYFLLGLTVAIPFVASGVDNVDEAAQDAPLGFRAIILPGTI